MIHNHEVILKKLIEQYYGLIPALTAQALLHHGVVTLKQALAFSHFNRQDFLKGLDVLVRCDFVKITFVKKLILLEIMPKNISTILYYPHYVALINKHYSVEASLLLKIVLLYGSLTLSELIEWTIFHFIKNESSEWSDEFTETCVDVFLHNFNLLKSNKILVCLNSGHTSSTQIDKDTIRESLAQKLQGETEGINLRDFDLEFNSRWTINIEALNCRFFIELFPLIHKPFECQQATDIMNVLLELHFENVHSLNKKSSLYLGDVHQKYQQTLGDNHFSIPKLEKLITFFSHYIVPGFIQYSKGNYQLKFGVLLLEITKTIVKEFIRKNFGDNSVKIFGSLLEEPRIMENTMLNLLKVSSKEFHRSIYFLDKSRMIEIDLFAEATQQSAFSTKNIRKKFDVNLENVVDCIMKRCHYTLYTLLSRKHLEMDEHSDLMQRKKHIKAYEAAIINGNIDEEEKNSRIQDARNLMSDNDHQQSEKLITYEKKGNRVEYDLVIYVFIFDMFRETQNH